MVIGILYPGELGSALGVLLVSRTDHTVIATLEGRSPRTALHHQGSGIELRPSFEDVVATSDVIVSVVATGAAAETAQRFRDAAAHAPRQRLFIDINSIGPERAEQVAGFAIDGGAAFCDGSIHGLAKNLADGAKLYLSGPGAEQAERVFSPVMRTVNLGPRTGTASLMKMALGGLSKSVSSAFLDIGVFAQSAGIGEAFASEAKDFYPGLMEAIDRLVPTMPKHCKRRSEEMRELAATMKAAGTSASFADAARGTFETLIARREAAELGNEEPSFDNAVSVIQWATDKS